MLVFLRHLWGIFLGIIAFLVMAYLPLYKIPHIQLILFVLISLAFLFIMGILFYRSYFKKGKACLFLILTVLLWMNNASAITQEEAARMGADRAANYGISRTETMSGAGQFCMAAEEYSQKTFYAEQNNWQGDTPCSETTRNLIRQKLETYSVVARALPKIDKWQKTWSSFRQDAGWPEWVSDNFASVPTIGNEREEVACAAALASMCSSYDDRHPTSLAKTVRQIMQEDAAEFGCWPCEMSFIVLTVVQSLSAHLSENMQNAGQDILQIFMLIWILYAVFQAVVFPSKSKTFLKEFSLRFISLIIAFLFLFSADNLYTLYESFLVPFISFGLGISTGINNAILEANLLSGGFVSQVSDGITFVQDNLCILGQTLSSQTGTNIWQELVRSIFPDFGSVYPDLMLDARNTLITPELEADLLCVVQRMYRQFSPLVAVGQSLIGFSFSKGIISSFLGGLFMENLKMWLIGWIITILFTIFNFLVAFKIIDIFLKLGFVLVLMPLFVATAVFPITREFTKKGFAFLLGIISEFLGLTLAVNFIILLFETGIASQQSQLVEAINAPYSEEYGNHLLAVVTSNDSLFFFFMLLGLFFLGKSLLESCIKLVNSIFSSPSVGGSLVGASAVRLTQRVGQLTKKTWDVSSKYAENAKPYEAPANDQSASSDKTQGNTGKESTPAASKRYFGEKTGNVLHRTSQQLASGIDKVGVNTGKVLQKSGVGAIIGVPLTIATKTLSTGIRATGKIASLAVKAPGATVSAIKNTFKGKKDKK